MMFWNTSGCGSDTFAASPGSWPKLEGQNVADLEDNWTGLEGANPDLGALQILKNADGTSHLVLQTADRLEAAPMIIACAVAEIQPEDVRAGREKLPDHGGVRTRRSECGDDLGLALTPHDGSVVAWRDAPAVSHLGPRDGADQGPRVIVTYVMTSRRWMRGCDASSPARMDRAGSRHPWRKAFQWSGVSVHPSRAAMFCC